MPAHMLAHNFKGVRRLKLFECKLFKETAGQISRELTNTSIAELYMGNSAGLHVLSQCNITLAHLTELELRHCNDIRLSMLSPKVFPALSDLNLYGTRAVFDTSLESLHQLSLRNSGSVDFLQVCQRCSHLKSIYVHSCKLLVDISLAKKIQLASLDQLILYDTTVTTMVGDILGREVQGYLRTVCRHATITIDGKVSHCIVCRHNS